MTAVYILPGDAPFPCVRRGELFWEGPEVAHLVFLGFPKVKARLRRVFTIIATDSIDVTSEGRKPRADKDPAFASHDLLHHAYEIWVVGEYAPIQSNAFRDVLDEADGVSSVDEWSKKRAVFFVCRNVEHLSSFVQKEDCPAGS